MLYIGVDLGTSSVKLLLMDEKGDIKNIVSEEYPLSFPQEGWSEQDPRDWYEKTLEGIARLTEGFDKKSIAGLSFGGQMHGLVILDEKDQVIRPAILWNDGRSQEQCVFLNESIGRDKISAYTANIAFAGFTAPKILWLREHEPESFGRIAKIMLPKDYLAYMLTGTFCTDVSDASGMLLFDVKNRCWSEEMIELCGIRKEMLAEIYESWECVGTLKKELADRLGLPENVKVAAGAGDNAAAAIGTGTVGEGRCNISLGTSGTVFISSDSFRVDKNNALHSFAHADGGYHLMGCMLSAASCNKWWMEDILSSQDYEGLQKGIERESLGKNSVYFLPYLMGERSPHNDALARAAFIGMSFDTKKEDMLQAVLEGVAFALKDCIEIAREQGIEISSSRLCGGGAKSPLWREILANVLNLRLEIPKSEQGPGMGAAMLAMVACGEYESVAEAARALVEVSVVVEPEKGLAESYQERYMHFKELYPALKGRF